MERLQFNLVFVLVFAFITWANGQNSFKEEFKVKPDVAINVNTRYTDIEIETWDRNEVVVEGFMKVEGEDITKEMRDDFYKKWKLEAIGNSSEITIKSRTNNFIDIHSFDFDNPDYEFFFHSDKGQNRFHFPEVSISGLDILDSIDFIIPEVPPMPELPALLGLPPIPEGPSEFDFEAYKKDKSYLERWKKENEDVLGKNPKVKVGENSITIRSKDANGSYNFRYSNDGDGQKVDEILKSIERSREAREKVRAERLEEIEKRKKEMAERLEALAERNKERAIARKLALVKRQEELKDRRKSMQDLLKNREKVKIRRVIKIKAPKNAKFNMDVKYGAMSFPK